MENSILRQGSWWHQRDDGVWLRYDASTERWEEQMAPPPPPLPHEATEQVMPQWVQPFQPIEGVARVLVFLIGLGLFLSLVGIVSSIAEYSLLGRIQSGEFVSDAQANANDARQAVIGLAQFVLYLVTIVVWLVWFRRAYRNLISLRVGQLRFKPGWAVGAWFVPFLNLVRPFQITKDIWTASNPDPNTEPGMWSYAKTPALLGWWWALWLISNFVDRIATRPALEATTIDELRRTSFLFILIDSTHVLVSILAILVVRGITKRQEERARNMALQPAVSS